MRLSLITDRLIAATSVLRKIGIAADLPAAEAELKQVPAAFVLPLTENAAPNELLSGAISQRTVVGFGVLLAVSNLRDAAGAAAQSDLDDVRGQVDDALLGWPPSDVFEPCEFARGQLVQIADRVLWWQDIYVTATYKRKVQ